MLNPVMYEKGGKTPIKISIGCKYVCPVSQRIVGLNCVLHMFSEASPLDGTRFRIIFVPSRAVATGLTQSTSVVFCLGLPFHMFRNIPEFSW
jgi:hypothetical protein